MCCAVVWCTDSVHTESVPKKRATMLPPSSPTPAIRLARASEPVLPSAPMESSTEAAPPSHHPALVRMPSKSIGMHASRTPLTQPCSPGLMQMMCGHVGAATLPTAPCRSSVNCAAFLATRKPQRGVCVPLLRVSCGTDCACTASLSKSWMHGSCQHSLPCSQPSLGGAHCSSCAHTPSTRLCAMARGSFVCLCRTTCAAQCPPAHCPRHCRL